MTADRAIELADRLVRTGREVDRIRRARDAACQRRDAAILRALAEGASQADIARMTGLTRGRVSQIVQRAGS